MNDKSISRRDSLLTIGAAAGALALGATRSTTFADAPASSRKRALRIAHLTDVHVQPERHAGEGMTACLRHVAQLDDKPQLVLTGGDSIMDSFAADDARTTLQWDLWRRVFDEECPTPVRSCIGNHDVWGWAKSKSKTTGQEANWGKKRAVEMLRIDDRYYTFNQGGWQFIILDSTQPHPDGSENYVAAIDPQQFDWLESTLRDTPATTPVLLLSHIPIISSTVLWWASENRDAASGVGWLMHGDYRKLKELFAKHPNVKLCLSGHTHLVDRVDYNGVTYLCNGAVCGNWWNGRHKDCDEGYAVLDLYDDGSFDSQYIKYGWKAKA